MQLKNHFFLVYYFRNEWVPLFLIGVVVQPHHCLLPHTLKREAFFVTVPIYFNDACSTCQHPASPRPEVTSLLGALSVLQQWIVAPGNAWC